MRTVIMEHFTCVPHHLWSLKQIIRRHCLVLKTVPLAQCGMWASPALQSSRLNTPNELAHNPSGAGSQPLGSKLPRGVGLGGKQRAVLKVAHASMPH